MTVAAPAVKPLAARGRDARVFFARERVEYAASYARSTDGAINPCLARVAG